MLAERPKALLLDFDGVVLDSADLKNLAYAQVYAGEPARLLDAVTAYALRHGGVTRRDKFDYFERTVFGRAADAASVDRLALAFRERVYDAVLRAPFIPGAERLLEVAQGAVALHVVSGTPHDELVDIVGKRGMAGRFESVRGAPPAKFERFVEILDETGLAPDDVWAVGDALTEFEAARALGMPFVGIVAATARNPFPPDTVVIEDLRPLAAMIGLDGSSPR